MLAFRAQIRCAAGAATRRGAARKQTSCVIHEGPGSCPIPPITQHDPGMLARRLLQDSEIAARERVAAILVAVYAQPIVRIARFRIDRITIGDTVTTIRLAGTPIALPDPIAAAVRAWLDQRQASMPPLASPSPWLFPGNPPSRAIGELSLGAGSNASPSTATTIAEGRYGTSPANSQPPSSPTLSAFTSTPPPRGLRSPDDRGATTPACGRRLSEHGNPTIAASERDEVLEMVDLTPSDLRYAPGCSPPRARNPERLHESPRMTRARTNLARSNVGRDALQACSN
jgi:hypothetical protein